MNRSRFTSGRNEPQQLIQSRFGGQTIQDSKHRAPLSDITNHYNQPVLHRQFSAPIAQEKQQDPTQINLEDEIEEMHLPPPDPKYEGVKVEVKYTTWFEGKINLDPMEFLDEVEWPNI